MPTHPTHARHQANYEARKKTDPAWRARREEIRRAWRARHPEKWKAQQLLSSAVRYGKIVRPTICDHCGQTGRIQAHHHDYSEPLAVEWLCSPCHGKAHRHTVEN